MTFVSGAIRMAGFVVAISVVAGLARGIAVADESVFRVADVSVDATANNATAAREFALGEGHSLAFQRLIERIVRAVDTASVPRLGHAEVAPMVRSFEVDNEKTSSVRYLARLTFQFDREAVRRFLRAIAVPFAETRGVQTLVLPVFRSAGTYLLRDEPNPWREAWTNLPETGELVPLMTPLGDLQDVQDISAAQAAGGNPMRLQAIAERYRAAEVVVAVAALRRGANRRPVIQVALSRYGADADEQTLIQSYQATASETVDQLIQTAAYRTRAQHPGCLEGTPPAAVRPGEPARSGGPDRRARAMGADHPRAGRNPLDRTEPDPVAVAQPGAYPAALLR